MSVLFTSQDITKLAACFSVNINSPSGNLQDLKHVLKHRINDLPRHLRRYSMTDQLLNKAKIRKDDREFNVNKLLCSAHNEIYSISTSMIFDSLRTELTRAVEYLNVENYINYVLGPDEYMTLHRVAAIQEMWTKPGPNTFPNERWKYQADQCEACMLSRIATYPSTLRELRTLFLVMHSPLKFVRPIILAFVDEWIKSTDQSKSLFKRSEERAKEIQKCIRHWRIHKGEEMEEEKADHQRPQNADSLETLPARSYKPTASPAQSIPSPLFSSTITRPLSRNEYELSEAEFLQEFSLNKPFYRTSSTEDDDTSSDITDIYSQDNDTRTSLGLGKMITVLQKQQIIDQYRDRGGTPDTGLSPRLYRPWSSTDEIRGSYSRLSQTTVSSPSHSALREQTTPPLSPLNNANPKTPDRYRTPVSPLANPRTPDRYIPPPKTPKTPSRNRTLLTIPEVSPFHVSPFMPSSSQNLR
ncbi:hypothetical protein EYB25_003729 [Talaromyces marneffei]|uniref:uncharacterized protein n=1 Tax=Talaromyces marneffei TaxID=37727 RepID=UPI0012A7CC53|nr:uncharacterized protein EYB26_006203 [Talaromyces marneffei]KAE8555181.1 hypothetical protein EYB25_003729 [Talaromyces marneffei]QGA18518.1 hypothetical protein EYB26_006203 [Talaromyces marneffei]